MDDARAVRLGQPVGGLRQPAEQRAQVGAVAWISAEASCR